MRYPTAVPRLALWKAAAVAGVLASSVAVSAGSASAAVFTIIPPTGSTAQAKGALLATAINNANSSPDAFSTIVLEEGAYAPTADLPPITKNLTITGDHANQQLSGGTGISGGNLSPSDSTLMTINPGASLTLEALTIRTQGVSGGTFGAVLDNGNLTMYNASILANIGPFELQVNSGATATITDSLVSDSADGDAIDIEGGTVTLKNSNVTNNFLGGINQNGTLNVINSILGNNDPTASGFLNCSSPANTSDDSLDSDGSCGFTDSGSKSGTTTAPLATGAADSSKNGGPIGTDKLATGSPAIGAGDPLACLSVDGRMFVHTGSGCDMGSYQTGATLDTTPPSCTVTGGSGGAPKTQQVTVQDTTSGLGPEGGAITDAINGSAVVGNNQADAVDGLTINNGTVSAAPFSSSGPSGAGVVLTATKTNQSALTMWSFTATNWAGVTRLCT